MAVVLKNVVGMFQVVAEEQLLTPFESALVGSFADRPQVSSIIKLAIRKKRRVFCFFSFFSVSRDAVFAGKLFRARSGEKSILSKALIL